MKKINLQKPFETNKKCHSVIVETDECESTGALSRALKFEVFRYITEDLSFSSPGGYDFQTLNVRHDGSKWIFEFTAIVDEH